MNTALRLFSVVDGAIRIRNFYIELERRLVRTPHNSYKMSVLEFVNIKFLISSAIANFFPNGPISPQLDFNPNYLK